MKHLCNYLKKYISIYSENKILRVLTENYPIKNFYDGLSGVLVILRLTKGMTHIILFKAK